MLRTLGRGGMGVVYEAFDTEGQQRVALKLILPERSRNADLRERFLRERDVLVALDHPAIVRLFAAGALDDGTLYLAMEMLRGETLAQRTGRLGPMHPAHLAPIVTALAGALDTAHQRGVVHRDVKPANVYLLHESVDVPAKLLDFGVARDQRSQKRSLTRTGSTIGTLRYMPPEQITGRKSLDRRADIYALGAVVHATLSGLPPFKGPSDAELAVEVLTGKRVPLTESCPQLPAVQALEAVIARAMALAPENRFDTAGELAVEFAAAARHAGPPPPPAPPPPDITDRNVLPDHGETIVDVMPRTDSPPATADDAATEVFIRTPTRSRDS